MRWDSTRTVPWKRLAIEWAAIGASVAAVSWFVLHNHKPGSYVAIVLAGGVYLGLGGVLAKLGYARKTLKQMRAEVAAQPVRTVGKTSAPAPRAKPAPTSRTSSGPSNRPQKRKR